MSTLFSVRGEDGRMHPVVSLRSIYTSPGGPCQSYYEECMNSGNAELRDCRVIPPPQGVYTDANGVCDFRRILRDETGFDYSGDFNNIGQAAYDVGTFWVVKLFDVNRNLLFQRIVSNQIAPSWFDQVVKIGITSIVGAAIGPLATQLGGSIIGPTLAAQYPALASAVGNTLIQTAATGGNVEAAVKSVATSYLGGQVGGFAQGVTDSAVIGKIAAGAATSVISGGDLLPAVAAPLISSVVSNVIDSLSTPALNVSQPATGEIMFEDLSELSFTDDSGYDFGGDYSFDSFGDGGYSFDLTDTGATTNQWFSFDDVSASYHDPVYTEDQSMLETGSFGEINFPDIQLPDPSIFLPDYQVTGGSDVPTTSGGTDWGAALAKLGTIAFQIYQQQGQKNIKAVTQSVRLPDGSVQVVNKNGTVTTTSPTGQSTTTQLPVGQPYRFPDGTVVMNNGNGSYTRQTATGQIATQQYTATNASGVSLPILAGGALLLVLLLRK